MTRDGERHERALDNYPRYASFRQVLEGSFDDTTRASTHDTSKPVTAYWMVPEVVTTTEEDFTPRTERPEGCYVYTEDNDEVPDGTHSVALLFVEPSLTFWLLVPQPVKDVYKREDVHVVWITDSVAGPVRKYCVLLPRNLEGALIPAMLLNPMQGEAASVSDTHLMGWMADTMAMVSGIAGALMRLGYNEPACEIEWKEASPRRTLH